MRDGKTKPKGRSRRTAAAQRGSAVFVLQVDLCYEELAPRLKQLARQMDARAVIFGLMCHLGWGLQVAQRLNFCTTQEAHLLLERTRRKGSWRRTQRAWPQRIIRADLTQLDKLPQTAPEGQQPFDLEAAEAFTKIGSWLNPMSRATSDLVVFTCVADILAHILDGQSAKVIESVWEWIRELALLSSPHD
jgi:hypothetical protein